MNHPFFLRQGSYYHFRRNWSYFSFPFPFQIIERHVLPRQRQNLSLAILLPSRQRWTPVERLIHSDRHEGPTPLHCQNPCCIFEANENFILDSTRIFMKAFHLLLFHGSFIFPECILIFCLILLLMIDSTSDQKDRPWFYFIYSTSLVMSITALFFRWREEPIISFSGNFQTNNFNEIFQFLI
ncbi:hypothetical protein IEQ34_025796 [Dendrobium chrysotoxum]|uniref:NAD(P)H-quinone oxidoreductase subunit 2 N-terminal domain-containing protein n=1 Tax=Dendrobium chrysotoxum TaxID=161865 RepID=A0AAV7FPF0_DENCH|nr:hypothetical protein IEQ34_025796 [Dendrobium chrysotoxum]